MMTREEGLKRFEEIINWMLPGMTMYYRDAQLPDAVVDQYQVGQIIRSKTFVDVSGYAGKPTKNTRFIFASSKAAPLYQINPDTAKYQFHAIACDSYFKVLDIYEAYGVKQLFLMHIPSCAIEVMKAVVIKIGDRDVEAEIIGRARKSLHDKWILPVADNLEDDHWVQRTSFPIGLDKNNAFFPLIPQEPLFPMAKPLQTAIKKMTKDTSELNESLYQATPAPAAKPAAKSPAAKPAEEPAPDLPWWKKLFK